MLICVRLLFCRRLLTYFVNIFVNSLQSLLSLLLGRKTGICTRLSFKSLAARTAKESANHITNFGFHELAGDNIIGLMTFAGFSLSPFDASVVFKEP